MSSNPLLKNNTPSNDITYKDTLPVSKKEVIYTAYKYGDKKLLDNLSGTNDNESVYRNLIDVISKRVLNIKYEELLELSVLDLEFIYLKIHIASNGSKTPIAYTCSTDGNKLGSNLDLNDAYVLNGDFKNDDTKYNIVINDSNIIHLKMPSVLDLFKSLEFSTIMKKNFTKLVNEKVDEYNEILNEEMHINTSAIDVRKAVKINEFKKKLWDEREDDDLQLIASYVDSVWVNDVRYELGYDGNTDQFTVEDLLEYLDLVDSTVDIEQHFTNFIEKLPRLVIDISLYCDKCNTTYEKQLNGIPDFFQYYIQ